MPTDVLIVNLAVLVAVLEADLGRRKISTLRILRPVLLAAGLVPLFITHPATSGNGELLELVLAGLGIILGLAASGGLMKISFDRTTQQAVSTAGAAYAAMTSDTPTSSDAPPPSDAPPSVRVLVADDQRAVREALATVLDAEPGIEVIGLASDGEEAVELAHRRTPDVVLMDLRMPNLDGVAATRRLAVELPDVKVVVLTTFADDSSILGALEAGATGFLTKDAGARADRPRRALRRRRPVGARPDGPGQPPAGGRTVGTARACLDHGACSPARRPDPA